MIYKTLSRNTQHDRNENVKIGMLQ